MKFHGLHPSEEIVFNKTKYILVLSSIKYFSCQSFRQIVFGAKLRGGFYEDSLFSDHNAQSPEFTDFKMYGYNFLLFWVVSHMFCTCLLFDIWILYTGPEQSMKSMIGKNR